LLAPNATKHGVEFGDLKNEEQKEAAESSRVRDGEGDSPAQEGRHLHLSGSAGTAATMSVRQESAIGFIPVYQGKKNRRYSSLKSPLCSCVSITLPDLSDSTILDAEHQAKKFGQ
jgi:hypothetical protein